MVRILNPELPHLLTLRKNRKLQPNTAQRRWKLKELSKRNVNHPHRLIVQQNQALQVVLNLVHQVKRTVRKSLWKGERRSIPPLALAVVTAHPVHHQAQSPVAPPALALMMVKRKKVGNILIKRKSYRILLILGKY